MNVTFETLVSVWDDQIPMLLINLVNTAVFARNGSEFKTAIRHLSESTDFDKFFAYGYGRNHFWLKQRLASDASKHTENSGTSTISESDCLCSVKCPFSHRKAALYHS